MSYHRDKDINCLLIHLMELLLSWERETGNGSTLILIPHNPKEKIFKAVDGKPEETQTVVKLISIAQYNRSRGE